MKADELKREFSSWSVPHEGDGPLLAPDDALALVARAAEEGVPILRVAGRRAAQGAVDDSPDHRVDYGDAVGQGHGCWEGAAAFIEARRALGLVFEVSLGDDPIEAV